MSSASTNKFRESNRRSSGRRSIYTNNSDADDITDSDPNQRYARAIQRNLAKDPELQSYLSKEMNNTSRSGSSGGGNGGGGELDDKVKKMDIEWEYLQPGTGASITSINRSTSNASNASAPMFIDVPNLKSAERYSNATMKPSEQFASAWSDGDSSLQQFRSNDSNDDKERNSDGSLLSAAVASMRGNKVKRTSNYYTESDNQGRSDDLYSNFGSRYRENERSTNVFANKRYCLIGATAAVACVIGSVLVYSNEMFGIGSSGGTVEDTNEAQFLALKDFHEKANGDLWTKSFGWLDEDISVCEWHGIACNDEGRVEELVLSRNNLVGSLSNKLDSLVHLKVLDLAENQLTGTIPDSITELKNLEEVYLFSNELTSSIPKHIGKLHNLSMLSLDTNSLSSSIPDSLFDLVNLKGLDLGSNSLSSAISPKLGSLINLQYLYLDQNMFTSSIPKEIGNLSSLSALYLQENNFSGQVPNELAVLTKLEEVLLFENNLSGAIPEALCISHRDLLQKLESDCVNEITCDADCCNRCF